MNATRADNPLRAASFSGLQKGCNGECRPMKRGYGSGGVRGGRQRFGSRMAVVGARFWSPARAVGRNNWFTVTASATGTASIEDAYSDRCSISFTARLVYLPDPKTGHYEVSRNLHAERGRRWAGQARRIDDYLARQPGPGTVSLMTSISRRYRDTCQLAPLDLFVDTSDERVYKCRRRPPGLAGGRRACGPAALRRAG